MAIEFSVGHYELPDIIGCYLKNPKDIEFFGPFEYFNIVRSRLFELKDFLAEAHDFPKKVLWFLYDFITLILN